MSSPYHEWWYGNTPEEEPPTSYRRGDYTHYPENDEEEDEIEEYIQALFRDISLPEYNWELRRWTCPCKTFENRGRCGHVLRFRSQEVLPVDPQYL